MKDIRIRVQGELFDAVVITGIGYRCGNITDGVAFHLHDNHKREQSAGGVMSWADLERAYLALKAARETPNESEGVKGDSR